MKLIITKFFALAFITLTHLSGVDTTLVEPGDKYNRTYSESIAFSENGKEYNSIDDSFLFFLQSDEALISAARKTQGAFKITFLDKSTLNPINTEIVKIKMGSTLLYSDSESLFYTNKLELYRYDYGVRESKRLSNETISIMNFAKIDDTTALCLGNVYDGNTKKHQFSIFKLDIKTGKLINIEKIIETSEENKIIENTLKYDSRFARDGDRISLYFKFYGKIILFNGQGDLKNEINTIDKVAPPRISHFLDTYTYDRSTTLFSNSGSIVSGAKLHVFSCRPNNTDFITIDTYNLETGEYKESHKLNYQGKKSSEIDFVSSTGDGEFVLGFENFYIGFDAD